MSGHDAKSGKGTINVNAPAQPLSANMSLN